MNALWMVVGACRWWWARVDGGGCASMVVSTRRWWWTLVDGGGRSSKTGGYHFYDKSMTVVLQPFCLMS